MMTSAVLIRERLKAALWHCLFSIVLLAIALCLVFQLWYPHTLAYAMGVTKLYTMILAIDLTLGPLLTFFVYKKDRRHFIKDLAVIVTIQFAAFVYGLYVVAQGKPSWLVFVVDDFEAVAPIDIDYRQQAEFPEHFFMHWIKSPQWIAATYSKDAKIQQQQKEDEMFRGISLAKKPESYHNIKFFYSNILMRSKPISELYKYNARADVDRQTKHLSSGYRWLPLKTFMHDQVVLIDRSGKPITVLNLNPW